MTFAHNFALLLIMGVASMLITLLLVTWDDERLIRTWHAQLDKLDADLLQARADAAAGWRQARLEHDAAAETRALAHRQRKEIVQLREIVRNLSGPPRVQGS